ncbi:hypothetical protein [Mucilaginibacter sp.]|jgi:hypothetical protein|uniref:YobI family P-loop NTPase n=1 Tax=Mucilaginibacter sp. TaxID=1882438 RepID=UPI0035644812
MQLKLKNILLRIIPLVQKKLSKLLENIGEPLSEKKTNYEDLTPIDDVKKSEPYLNALNWALKNQNIKNIALTGPYGSGKTSILKTFKKSYPEYYYLNISLGSFQDEIEIQKEESSEIKKPDTKPTNYEERHRLIELSILQQMFYKVEGRDIPDSRFNRIKSLGNIRLFMYILIVFITITGLSILFTPTFWESLSWWNNLTDPYCDWFKYFALILLAPSLYFLSRYIIRLFNFSKFNKINLTKGELEFDPKSETSILNKHLDEILYYFEVTSFNVVFIEDLDRFNDPEIFTKLRELNILINQSGQVNRRIVFIYVIKDDMFKDKTRTKFFDFIIPIVPVINSSNSFDIMIKKIEDTGLNLNISEKFLSDVTLFIDDMRVLKNIFNEFLLYRESLNDITLKDEELFAMIVYKNMYPSDFAFLHNKSGILHGVFESARAVKNEIIKQKTNEITTITKSIRGIEDNKHLSIEELRSVYLVEIISEFDSAIGIIVNGEMKTLAQIRLNQIDFDWLTKQSNIAYYHYSTSYGQNRQANTGKSFLAIETKVNSKSSFKERETLINEHILNGVNKLKSDIEKLTLEINVVQKQKIAQMLKSEPDPIGYFDDRFQNAPLLVYLIRNGYINEHYNILISYFYPGHLMINDMEFALSVANRELREFDFELNKVEKLISRLDVDDFTEPAILNYNLTDYILIKSGTYKEHFVNLFKQLSNESDIVLQYIDSYFINGKQKPKFFKNLFKNWSGGWDYIANTSNFSKEKQISYLKIIAVNVDGKDINTLNKNGSLAIFITDLSEFIEIFKDPHEFAGAKKLLDNINIYFPILSNVEASKELLTYIYENWMYELNENMIKIMITQKANNSSLNISMLDIANYTTIKSSGAKQLYEYILEDLNTYVETIILSNINNTQEDESAVIELLNFDVNKLSINNKTKLIEHQLVKISKVESIVQKDLWSTLFDNKKLEINWQNTLDYFEYVDKLDSHLFDYLSYPEVYNNLRKINFNTTNKGDKLNFKFSLETLLKNEFSNDVYDALIQSNPYHYNGKLDVTDLSDDKVEKLIKKKLTLNIEQFELIKEKFPKLVGQYIGCNIASYLNNKNLYALVDTDYVDLFKSSISNANKINLLGDLTEDKIERNTLLASYAGSVISSDPDYVITNSLLSIIITKSIFKSDSIVLFEKYLPQIDLSLTDKLLESLDEPYKRLSQRGKQVKLPLNNFNITIIEKLQMKGYLKSFAFEKNWIRVYNKKTL